jgi:Skp family chaperone for outer membrane proteins
MQSKRNPWLILAVVAAIAVVAVSISHTVAQPAPRTDGPSRVAVCDITKVFADYQRAKDLTEQLSQKRNKFEAENTRRQKHLEALSEEIAGYQPGSDKYDEVQDNLRRGLVEREVWARMEQQTILNEHLRLTKEMYEEIKAAIAEVAKQQNIDIVVQETNQPIEAQNAQQLIMQIHQRQVLYNSPALDITEVVLLKVNESYRVKGK